MNTAYDEAYEARISRTKRADKTAGYDEATDAYIQAVKNYENAIGNPTWVNMDSKRYGNGDPVRVMLIEHGKNPDYYMAYFLTSAGYICMHRHIALDTWENMCSKNPAPAWFVENAVKIRLKNKPEVMQNTKFDEIMQNAIRKAA
mgnify:CR=1 FL=1